MCATYEVKLRLSLQLLHINWLSHFESMGQSSRYSYCNTSETIVQERGEGIVIFGCKSESKNKIIIIETGNRKDNAVYVYVH